MLGTVSIVGAGQIGYAAHRAFAAAGWGVHVLARTAPQWPIESGSFQRYVAGEDAAPLSDVIVDTIAFDEADIARYDTAKTDRLIVVSSASVYCDSVGRTLDEAAQNGFPQFECAITEDQPTVKPRAETYSTRKVRMEHAALARFGKRATILRPCAIHGPWSRHPREWWFVKRILDGRRTIPLAHQGESRFQTTAARLLGEACERTASRSMGGIFNISDDDSPRVDEIGRAIADGLGASVDFVGFIGHDGPVGRTPWSIPRPMKVSGECAVAALDLAPLPYSFAVDPALNWLAEDPPANWRDAFPQLALYPWDLFDYSREDRFLAGR